VPEHERRYDRDEHDGVELDGDVVVLLEGVFVLRFVGVLDARDEVETRECGHEDGKTDGRHVQTEVQTELAECAASEAGGDANESSPASSSPSTEKARGATKNEKKTMAPSQTPTAPVAAMPATVNM
jgi:hypothetical protein